MSYVETTVSLTTEKIGTRDIMDRVESLRNELDFEGCLATADEQELGMLEGILFELSGYGGGEEFDGDWYPSTLVSDGYFECYAQELAEDCGVLDPNASWPMCCIDWAQAARELQQDYGSISIQGETYWYR